MYINFPLYQKLLVKFVFLNEFQPRRRPLLLTPWPRPVSFTAFPAAAETASCPLAAARRPKGRKISGRNGSGEAAVTTFITDTSKYFDLVILTSMLVSYFTSILLNLSEIN